MVQGVERDAFRVHVEEAVECEGGSAMKGFKDVGSEPPKTFNDAVEEDNSEVEFRGKRIFVNKKFIGYYFEGFYGIIVNLPKKEEWKFNTYGSWGIPIGLLQELYQIHAWLIRIMTEKGRILSVKPENWIQRGFYHRSPKFEPQWHLRELDFDKIIE